MQSETNQPHQQLSGAEIEAHRQHAATIVANPEFRRKLSLRIGRLVGGRSFSVDDVIQSAFLKIFAPPFPPKTDLFGWLLVVCQNRGKDMLKAESRRPENKKARSKCCSIPESPPESQDSEPGSFMQGYVEAIDATSPAEKMMRREERSKIRHAAESAKFSKELRCALWAWVRNDIDGYAMRHGVPPVSVRVWASRARLQLKPHLEQIGFS